MQRRIARLLRHDHIDAATVAPSQTGLVELCPFSISQLWPEQRGQPLVAMPAATTESSIRTAGESLVWLLALAAALLRGFEHALATAQP